MILKEIYAWRLCKLYMPITSCHFRKEHETALDSMIFYDILRWFSIFPWSVNVQVPNLEIQPILTTGRPNDGRGVPPFMVL